MRDALIQHILNMKTLDIEYAREALKFYDELLPWLDLKAGIKLAMVKP